MRNPTAEKLTLQQAKDRALAFMCKGTPGALFAASQIAYAIWPDRNMRAQGAGLAGARVLAALQDDGKVRYVTEGVGGFRQWGYQLCRRSR